jgi:hypothetical protein
VAQSTCCPNCELSALSKLEWLKIDALKKVGHHGLITHQLLDFATYLKPNRILRVFFFRVWQCLKRHFALHQRMNNSTLVIITGSTFFGRNRLALPEIFIICAVLSLEEGQWAQ